MSCSRFDAQTSVEDFDPRNRYHEPTAPLAHKRQLLRDLIAKVPWEDEHEIGSRLSQCVRVTNWNLRPRKILPLLVRAAVDRELDKVASNAAVVEERIALAR